MLLNSLFPFVPIRGDSGYEIQKETSLIAKVDPFLTDSVAGTLASQNYGSQ